MTGPTPSGPSGDVPPRSKWDFYDEGWRTTARAGDAWQPGAPATFHEVFTRELREIAARREREPRDADADGSQPAARLRESLEGLALSGGGIRSATFCLGFLQGFAGKRRLMDYLSTVSGGGFIGGWWTAWLNRPKGLGQAAKNDGFPPNERLEPQREADFRLLNGIRLNPGQVDLAHVPAAEGSLDAGRDPIRHVRLFSNYLTPRKGILGSDLWRAINVIGRNMLLAWTTLVPLLFMCVLLAQLYFVALPDAFTSEFASAAQSVLARRLVLVAVPVLLGFVALLTLTALWMLASATSFVQGALVMVGILAATTFAYIVKEASDGVVDGPSTAWTTLVLVGVSVPVVLSLLLLGWNAWKQRWIGTGVSYTGRREYWRNRLASWQTRVLLAVVLVGVILLFGALGDYMMRRVVDGVRHKVAAAGWGATLLAIASAIWTLVRASPAGGKDAKEADGRVSTIVMRLAPPLVLLVLLAWLALAAAALTSAVRPELATLELAVMLGTGVCLLFTVFEGITDARAPATSGWRPSHRVVGLLAMTLAGVVVIAVARSGSSLPESLRQLAEPPALATLQLAYLAGAWVVALGWMIDPNVTSMHNFYKARLTRAYMGASNLARDAQEITESHALDDVVLSTLDSPQRGGPYHLVNTTLNLTAGRGISTGQRTGASFVLSSLYCGSGRTGYRQTGDYMGNAMTLGTAVAVSGAAASPVMGTQSPNAALSLLMALFNIRLGFWAPNPSQSRWRSSRPRLWWYYLLSEAISQTNELGPYCYLTDGGHFDNTAAYSLVERACKRIVIVDCGADPDYHLNDVATLVRMCREDFNAEITFDPLNFLGGGPPKVAYLEGEIVYDPRHLEMLGWGPASGITVAQRTGRIWWVKPNVLHKSPVDVVNYDKSYDVFPQQSTADQWFDEAQFESYRCLGERAGKALAGIYPRRA